MTISAERQEQNRKYRRNKKLKHYCAVFFVFAVIAWVLIMMLPSKEIKTINGKLLNRSAISTGKYSGTHPRAFVQLENGKKVTATVPKNFIFVENTNVKVSTRTSYLGFKTYSVLWKSKEQ